MTDKLPYTCNNEIEQGHKDCVSVEKRFGTCEVCNRIWKEKIVIETNDENPHLPNYYKQAVQIFIDKHWVRFRAGVYKFKVKLLKQEYIYYDFGERNHWELTFKVNKYD